MSDLDHKLSRFSAESGQSHSAIAGAISRLGIAPKGRPISKTMVYNYSTGITPIPGWFLDGMDSAFPGWREYEVRRGPGRPNHVASTNGVLSLGAFLKKARLNAEKSPSQLEVARAIGVSRVAISDYERDKYQPFPEALAAMLSLYDVKPEHFTFDVPVAEPYGLPERYSEPTDGDSDSLTLTFSSAGIMTAEHVIRWLSAADKLVTDLAPAGFVTEIMSIETGDSGLTVRLRAIDGEGGDG